VDYFFPTLQHKSAPILTDSDDTPESNNDVQNQSSGLDEYDDEIDTREGLPVDEWQEKLEASLRSLNAISVRPASALAHRITSASRTKFYRPEIKVVRNDSSDDEAPMKPTLPVLAKSVKTSPLKQRIAPSPPSSAAAPKVSPRRRIPGAPVGHATLAKPDNEKIQARRASPVPSTGRQSPSRSTESILGRSSPTRSNQSVSSTGRSSPTRSLDSLKTSRTSLSKSNDMSTKLAGTSPTRVRILQAQVPPRSDTVQVLPVSPRKRIVSVSNKSR
jgi:hypothetical protein